MTSPLSNLKVVEASTLFAGPLAAMHLGDFGAEVIKIEHPEKPDPARGHGPTHNGVNLWSKTLGRNKRNIALDLSSEEGANILLTLLESADVFIENFRPGVLDRWGITLERLMSANPQLVVVRITAFGQSGPYSGRPGFGTLAEAMSGFAATTGEPDGPPTLPPFGLADGVTGLTAAFAAMVALNRRSMTGVGGEVDVSILEPMMMMMGPQISAYESSGYVQPRTGNRSASNAPRNVYKTRDQKWIAVSTSSQSIAQRVLELVGRPDLTEQPWFSSGKSRAENADVLDEAVGSWIRDRDSDEVLSAFENAQAAAAPIYDVSELVVDPQVVARGTVIRLKDDELGELSMQNTVFKIDSENPEIRWTGKAHATDTDQVLLEIGLSALQIAALKLSGVVK